MLIVKFAPLLAKNGIIIKVKTNLNFIFAYFMIYSSGNDRCIECAEPELMEVS